VSAQPPVLEYKTNVVRRPGGHWGLIALAFSIAGAAPITTFFIYDWIARPSRLHNWGLIHFLAICFYASAWISPVALIASVAIVFRTRGRNVASCFALAISLAVTLFVWRFLLY
jgi:hypothetical protein